MDISLMHPAHGAVTACSWYDAAVLLAGRRLEEDGSRAEPSVAASRRRADAARLAATLQLRIVVRAALSGRITPDMDEVVAEILSHPRASSSLYGSLLDWDSPVIPLVLSRGSFSSEAEMPTGSGIRWIDPATDESLVRSWASAAGAILTVEE